MGYFTANVKFNYSKPIPFWMRPAVEREYLRLRRLACDALNPYYEEWNKEYETLHPAEIVDPDDELKDFGGTEYCRFLNNKQQPIFDEINRKHATDRIRLYPTKECDIGASIHGRNNKQISTVYITLSNVGEIVWDD